MERGVVGSKQEIVGRKVVVGEGNFQEIDVVGEDIQIKPVLRKKFI